MRTNLFSVVPGVISLTGVSFHFTTNIAFVYSVFGLDIHLATVAIAMLGIHVFLFLRELGQVSIEGQWTNLTLNILDILFQGMVLVPFFIDSKGGMIDLSKVDAGFWLHVLLVAGGIALFRFVVYLFLHCTYKKDMPSKLSGTDSCMQLDGENAKLKSEDPDSLPVRELED